MLLLTKKLILKITSIVAAVLVITFSVFGIKKHCQNKQNKQADSISKTSTSSSSDTHINTQNRSDTLAATGNASPNIIEIRVKSNSKNDEQGDSSLIVDSENQDIPINISNDKNDSNINFKMECYIDTHSNKLDTNRLARDIILRAFYNAKDNGQLKQWGNASFLSNNSPATLDFNSLLADYGYIQPFDNVEDFEQLKQGIDTRIEEITSYIPSMVTERNLSFSNGKTLAQFFPNLKYDNDTPQKLLNFILDPNNNFSIADVVCSRLFLKHPEVENAIQPYRYSPQQVKHLEDYHSDKLYPNGLSPISLSNYHESIRKYYKNLPLSITNFCAKQLNLTANNIYSFNDINKFKQFLTSVDNVIDQLVNDTTLFQEMRHEENNKLDQIITENHLLK